MCSAAAAALAAALPAAAETQAGAGGPAVAAPAQPAVGEVIVTARRRQESAQRVPIALSAVTPAQLDRGGVVDLTRVQQVAPSLQLTVTNPRNTNINIRGLGSTPAYSNPGLEYGVGIYVDQVYYARPGQSTFDLFDIDRVEVLRGPQGTLFGKNTTAGAINISTREPTFTPEFRGDVSGGNYAYHQIRATVSGPIKDDLAAVRLSATSTDRDEGNVENVHDGGKLGDYHSRAIRGQLLLTPTSDLRVRVTADYATQKQNCCIGTFVGVSTHPDGSPLPNNFFDRAARAGYTPLPADTDPDRRLVDLDTPTNLKMRSGGVSAIVDWTTDYGTLTSVTAGRTWGYRPVQDADVIGLSILPNAGVNEDERQFSQELRFASKSDGPFDYVVGAYYLHQHIQSNFFTLYGPDAALWVLGPATPGGTTPSAFGQAALNGLDAEGYATSTTDSYAAFAQGTYKFGDFSLTGGLRYTDERKSGSFNQQQLGGVDPATLPAALAAAVQATRNAFAPVVAFSADTKEKDVSGLATLAWQATPDVMAYATYSHGFKSGGLNLTVLPAGISPVLEPEKADDYEVGVKSQFLDRRLTVNLAAFWTEVKDYQSSQIDTSRASVAYIANVGKVRSRGVEADVSYVPITGLTLTASGVALDATYVDYRNAPCPVEYLGLATTCDLSGRPLPGASKWSGSASAAYRFPLTERLTADVSADYSYRSSFYSTFNLSEISRISDYSLVNAQVGLTDQRSGLGVRLWVRNLFDKNYATIVNPAAFNTGYASANFGDPRTFGVTLSASF